MSRLPPLPIAGAPGYRPAHAAADADPRPDLGQRDRFGDSSYWQLVLRVFNARDPEIYALLVALRRAGARIVCVPQPGDLAPEGPRPDWRLAAGAIPATAWPRWRAQVTGLTARLAHWLKLESE